MYCSATGPKALGIGLWRPVWHSHKHPTSWLHGRPGPLGVTRKVPRDLWTGEQWYPDATGADERPQACCLKAGVNFSQPRQEREKPPGPTRPGRRLPRWNRQPLRTKGGELFRAARTAARAAQGTVPSRAPTLAAGARVRLRATFSSQVASIFASAHREEDPSFTQAGRRDQKPARPAPEGGATLLPLPTRPKPVAARCLFGRLTLFKSRGSRGTGCQPLLEDAVRTQYVVPHRVSTCSLGPRPAVEERK